MGDAFSVPFILSCFRGIINVILRKQIGMARSFSLFPAPPLTQQLQDVDAPFVF